MNTKPSGTEVRFHIPQPKYPIGFRFLNRNFLLEKIELDKEWSEWRENKEVSEFDENDFIEEIVGFAFLVEASPFEWTKVPKTEKGEYDLSSLGEFEYMTQRTGQWERSSDYEGFLSEEDIETQLASGGLELLEPIKREWSSGFQLGGVYQYPEDEYIPFVDPDDDCPCHRYLVTGFEIIYSDREPQPFATGVYTATLFSDGFLSGEGLMQSYPENTYQKNRRCNVTLPTDYKMEKKDFQFPLLPPGLFFEAEDLLPEELDQIEVMKNYIVQQKAERDRINNSFLPQIQFIIRN